MSRIPWRGLGHERRGLWHPDDREGSRARVEGHLHSQGHRFPGWDPAASDPADCGIVAKAYPDTAFIVYHSAIEFDPKPAARIYGVDPDAIRCKVPSTSTARTRNVMDGELGGRRWSFQEMGGPRTRCEFLDLARHTGGKPG